MARKVERLTIVSEGRDKGKTFILTEMPADQAERWAIRALLALTNSGVQIDEDVAQSGMAGLAAAGFQALGHLSPDAVEPLLEEMFQCVTYEHDPKHPPQAIYSGINSQIEEVKTRFQIRLALFKLHTGFSWPVASRKQESQTGPAG